MKLVITIALGNDAMRTPRDVAEAVSRHMKRLGSKPFEDFETDWPSGPIRDVNGNKVGEWEVLDD